MTFLTFLRTNARWLGAGALLSFASSFGQTFFVSVFSGEIRSEFGLSHGAWGSIYALGTMLSAITMVWAGTLTDRMRTRELGALVFAGLGIAALAMAFSPWVALLPIIIFGLRILGQGMCVHLSMVSMSRWFDASRGKALSIATLGLKLGEATLPLLFVFALGFASWRMLWIAIAVAAFAMIPVLRRLLTLERTPQSMAETNETRGMNNTHWTRSAAMRHPLFWIIVPLVLGPPTLVTALFFQQVPLTETKSWSHMGFVALFPIFTLVSTIALAATGWAVDRFGAARLFPLIGLPLAIGFAGLSVSTDLAAALMAMCFVGVGIGASNVVLSSFLAEFYGTRHLGAIKAAVTSIAVFGSAVGPVMSGTLMDNGIGIALQLGGYAVYFAMTVILGLVAIPSHAKFLTSTP